MPAPVLMVLATLLFTTMGVCVKLASAHYGAGAQMLTNASLQYLGIAFSFGYGALLFHDPVTWMAAAGMLLIAAAGLTATLVRSRTAPKDTQESTTEP